MGYDGFDKHDGIYSSRLKAGKRTYFFDVRETRGGEYFFTVTELLKKTGRDGKPFTSKHKVFVYKEDFDTFTQELTNIVDFIRKEKGEDYGAEGRVYDDEWNDEDAQGQPSSDANDNGGSSSSDYSADVKFEDL